MKTHDTKSAAMPIRTDGKTCPICEKTRDPSYDPFCSRRCADVDLHRWLKGSYVIPGANAEPEPGDEDA
jgi:uncharacterized protein